ncbi:synembryn [Anaeramoeba flamelloides]|uniref:Synembryn n=1 Tax=Anaeramoeba flamelloides TaxID=1746091 RepID=A0AAV7ZJA8_9EUKA|nr:synembryn [Anaeramoeba flamelloides]
MKQLYKAINKSWNKEENETKIEFLISIYKTFNLTNIESVSFCASEKEQEFKQQLLKELYLCSRSEIYQGNVELYSSLFVCISILTREKTESKEIYSEDFYDLCDNLIFKSHKQDFQLRIQCLKCLINIIVKSEEMEKLFIKNQGISHLINLLSHRQEDTHLQIVILRSLTYFLLKMDYFLFFLESQFLSKVGSIFDRYSLNVSKNPIISQAIFIWGLYKEKFHQYIQDLKQKNKEKQILEKQSNSNVDKLQEQLKETITFWWENYFLKIFLKSDLIENGLIEKQIVFVLHSTPSLSKTDFEKFNENLFKKSIQLLSFLLKKYTNLSFIELKPSKENKKDQDELECKEENEVEEKREVGECDVKEKEKEKERENKRKKGQEKEKGKEKETEKEKKQYQKINNNNDDKDIDNEENKIELIQLLSFLNKTIRNNKKAKIFFFKKIFKSKDIKIRELITFHTNSEIENLQDQVCDFLFYLCEEKVKYFISFVGFPNIEHYLMKKSLLGNKIPENL